MISEIPFDRAHVGPASSRPLSGRGASSSSALRAVFFGALLLGGCARKPPPAAPPDADLVATLREENRDLTQRVADLEAERDRLREKLEKGSPPAEPSAAASGTTESEPESIPSGESGMLPVVKLAPEGAGTSSTDGQPAEAPRPILRAYGEEEGEVILGGEAEAPPKAAPRSKPKKPAPAKAPSP